MAAFKVNVFKDDLYILCMSVWFGLEKDRFYVSYRLNQQLSQSGCTFLRNTPTGDLRKSQITIESSKRDSIGIDWQG